MRFRSVKEYSEQEGDFLAKLQEKYTHSKIELFMLDDKKQTLKIDGEQINFCWIPRLVQIADKGAISILLEDCKTSIEAKLSLENTS
jgi:hypothetical protein